MAVPDELATVVTSIKQQLHAQGALSAIRAQLRARVFGALAGTAAPEAELSMQRCTALALGLLEELLLFHGCDRALHVVAAEISGWSTRVKPSDLAPALRMADGSAATTQPMLATLIQAYHGLIEGAVPPGAARTGAEPAPDVDPVDYAREGTAAHQAAAASVEAERVTAAERVAAKAKMEEERRAKREAAKRTAAERAKREEEAREEAARLEKQRESKEQARKAEAERVAAEAAAKAKAEAEAAERAAAEAERAAAQAAAAAAAEAAVVAAAEAEAEAEAEAAAALLARARAADQARSKQEADRVEADRVEAERVEAERAAAEESKEAEAKKAKEEKEEKEAEEAKKVKEARETKAAQQAKDAKEAQDAKETQDAQKTKEAKAAEARLAALEKSRREAEEAFGGGMLSGPPGGRGTDPVPTQKEAGLSGRDSGSLLGALPALGASRGGGSLLGDLPGLGLVLGGRQAERGRTRAGTDKKRVSFAEEEPVEWAARDGHAEGSGEGEGGGGGVESEAAGGGVGGAGSLAGVRGLHAALEETPGTAVGKGVMDVFMKSVMEREGAGRAAQEAEDRAIEERKVREATEAAAQVAAVAAAAAKVEEGEEAAAKAERQLLEEYDSVGSSEEDLTHTLEASSDDSDGGGAWGSSQAKRACKSAQGNSAMAAGGGVGGGGVGGGGCASGARPMLLEALSDSEDDGGVGFGAEPPPGITANRAGGKLPPSGIEHQGDGSTSGGSRAEEGFKVAVARPVMRWEDEEGAKETDEAGGALPAISRPARIASGVPPPRGVNAQAAATPAIAAPAASAPVVAAPAVATTATLAASSDEEDEIEEIEDLSVGSVASEGSDGW